MGGRLNHGTSLLSKRAATSRLMSLSSATSICTPSSQLAERWSTRARYKCCAAPCARQMALRAVLFTGVVGSRGGVRSAGVVDGLPGVVTMGETFPRLVGCR